MENARLIDAVAEATAQAVKAAQDLELAREREGQGVNRDRNGIFWSGMVQGLLMDGAMKIVRAMLMR